MTKATLKQDGQDGNIARGIGLMLLSALMFALAGVAVKFAIAELSVFALVFWRNLLSFFLFLLWMYFAGFSDIKTTRIALAFSSPCGVAHRHSVVHILNVCSLPRSSRALPDNEKIAGSAMNRLGASEASPKGAYQG